MTKAELEKALEEAESNLAKVQAELELASDKVREITEEYLFLSSMLDIVDQRSNVFYKDWRGYASRSRS
ncbi:hypothetical protein [Pseudomonas phage HMGUpa2]|nr:hypothetical protein [Pseudomonas phage HMGUpa2]